MAKQYRRLIERYQVAPGSRIRLRDLDPADNGGPEFASVGPDRVKERAAAFLEANRAELARAQELLWASDTHAVLVVLQAMDAAGKDGIVKHVMSGVNPQGCEVHAFKRPSPVELKHNFLWRYWLAVPERGRIGIFNRSYYEDVLIAKVHPQLLAAERLPAPGRRGALWAGRYDDINRFERHLARNGTVIVKFFLNVSKAEQKRRLLQRIAEPEKHWKFSLADLEERAYWREYMGAYQDLLRATSTAWAPWYVIPADHKYVARALVAAILSSTIGALGLRYPRLTRAQLRQLGAARRRLFGGG
ncbi:MAG TPA: polyphosphate kinase 2 family protein [Steroidobacteraceae bacterium]|nr:polyphosphate kinase 2 family protein [Steroidobacteraceae bacterium]